MAITKIAGELLESNLIRTTDLAFNTNLLVVDVDNGRIGVGTATPGNFKLDVVGDIEFGANSYGLIEEDSTTVRYKNTATGTVSYTHLTLPTNREV